jgi:hypothetical protein
VRDLYIPTIGLPILLEDICRPILGLHVFITHRHMNVEIGAEAALFPEKEYISGIFVEVQVIPADDLFGCETQLFLY